MRHRGRPHSDHSTVDDHDKELTTTRISGIVREGRIEGCLHVDSPWCIAAQVSQGKFAPLAPKAREENFAAHSVHTVTANSVCTCDLKTRQTVHDCHSSSQGCFGHSLGGHWGGYGGAMRSLQTSEEVRGMEGSPLRHCNSACVLAKRFDRKGNRTVIKTSCRTTSND